MNVVSNGSSLLVIGTPGPRGFMQRVRDWFSAARQPPPALTIPEFFASLKNSTKELYVVKERALGYEKQLEDALYAGQRALYEQLSRAVVGVRAETQLVAAGQTKYLEEASLVEFVKKAPKGLRLDWVANFTRTIPSDWVDEFCDLTLDQVADTIGKNSVKTLS